MPANEAFMYMHKPGTGPGVEQLFADIDKLLSDEHDAICAEDGCEKPVYNQKRGWCRYHVERFYRQRRKQQTWNEPVD